MSRKKVIMIALIIGSMIGGYAPTLFGVSAISFSALFWSTVGAILGVYIAWNLTK